MAPTCSLSGYLSPLVPLRWLGLSPHPGDHTFKTMAATATSALLILSAGVGAWRSEFYLQVPSTAGVLLYTVLRNYFNRTDFQELLASYQDMEVLSGRLRYGFRWSFLSDVAHLALKITVVFIEGSCLSDVLIIIYILKQEEVFLLIHVLSRQSEVLEGGDLAEYRLLCRALERLRGYLSMEVPLACFLCCLWIMNSSFLGVRSMVWIVQSPPAQPTLGLYCACYWASCLFPVMSLVAMVTCYNRIEEQKEEFEENLYWFLLTVAPQRISAKHMMLFEVCSREHAKEDLQIGYRIIYSTMSAAVAFLVILLQFEFEDIYCTLNKV